MSSEAGSHDAPEGGKLLSPEDSEGDKTYTGSSSNKDPETVIPKDSKQSDQGSLSPRSQEPPPPLSVADMEKYLGDYLDRWEAYGGHTLEKQTSLQKSVEEEVKLISEQGERKEAGSIEEEVLEKEGVSPMDLFEEKIPRKIQPKKHVVPKPKSPQREVLKSVQPLQAMQAISGIQQDSGVLSQDTQAVDPDERLYENVDESMIFKKSEDLMKETDERAKTPTGAVERADLTHVDQLKYQQKVDHPQNLKSAPPTKDQLSPIDALQPRRPSSSSSARKTPSPLPSQEG